MLWLVFPPRKVDPRFQQQDWLKNNSEKENERSPWPTFELVGHQSDLLNYRNYHWPTILSTDPHTCIFSFSCTLDNRPREKTFLASWSCRLPHPPSFKSDFPWSHSFFYSRKSAHNTPVQGGHAYKNNPQRVLDCLHHLEAPFRPVLQHRGLICCTFLGSQTMRQWERERVSERNSRYQWLSARQQQWHTSDVQPGVWATWCYMSLPISVET